MHIVLAIFGLLFIAVVLQVYFNIPVFERFVARVEYLCSGSWGRLFLWPVAFAVGLYGVTLLVCAPFMKLQLALTEVSTACVLGLMLGMFSCFFSFTRNAASFGHARFTGTTQRAEPDTRIIFSAFFITCMYGSIGALFFVPTSSWYVL